MARRKWRKFELVVEHYLNVSPFYRNVRPQLVVAPRRKARERRPAEFRGFKYVTPRFDVVATKNISQRDTYFECKRYGRNVGKEQVVSFAYHLWLCMIPYNRGVVVVHPGLTKDAMKEVDRYGFDVWQGASLERRLAMEGVLRLSPFGLPVAAYHSAKYLASMIKD